MVVLALVFACTAAANTASFNDPAGDASGAPDVTDVTVEARASGVLAFVVRVADASAWDGASLDLMALA